MPDGGEFDIKVDGVVIDTINCNGVEDNTKKSAPFIVPKDGNASVSPKTDNIAYVYGIEGRATAVADTPKFYNISTGGRKLGDYTDAEIEDNVSVFDPDLYIMALGANDYGSGTPTPTAEFLRKVKIACDKAVSLGADVLLMIMNRNEPADTVGLVQDRFLEMSNGLKDLAIEKGYGLVSVDDAWGGWQKATDDGLVGDIVHPTNLGLQAIAQIMSNILFGSNYDIHLWTDQNRDTRFQISNDKAEILQNKLTLRDGISKGVEDNNGNITSYTELLNIVVKPSKSAFPKNPEKGSYAFNTGTNVLYVCIKDNSDELGAEWLPCDGRVTLTYNWTPPEIPAGGSVLSPVIYGDNSLLGNSFFGKRAESYFNGDTSDFIINTDTGGGSWYRILIWNLSSTAKTPPSGDYRTVFYAGND
jgi:hypothetical protein